ncbi:two-component system, OmpR family, KDP operon response regulator KdpE [Pilibacter termitis]|uniref:Two-component system, OmpR family, KDP operon response regulator KdpE n=1 Tax=Pilibacter termitis TaxID=263852 RepID=A0A1T4M5Z3_9ENTE|nr:response regulator transcription factor [Pilibacter termitis]SJZ62440.1 two-component system, OmpR family, KDP operon response regulator KdpE [Pilibacter termitis]
MRKLKETILIVEDDAQIRNFICYSLKLEEFHYLSVSTAKSAMEQVVAEKIDLILLDLGLPDLDGLEVIRKIREWSDIPILVISARDQEKEKVEVLDAGADDYLTKPFSMVELLARIRVALRHLKKQNNTTTKSIVAVGNLRIDFEKHLVFLNNSSIHLTPMEYKLLALFFQNIGKVLTTKMIIKEIWGIGYGEDTQALRALMSALRRKIETNPAQPEYIITEIGIGYRLKEKRRSAG